MSIFKINTLGHPALELAQVGKVYKLYNLTAPSTYGEFRKLVTDAPTVDQVAAQYADQFHESDNPAKLVKEAKAAIADALAAAELKTALLKSEERELQQRIKGIKERMVEDLTPAFQADMEAFTEAAKQLSPDNPLDPEAAIANDAGGALTTARNTIPRLAAIASLFAQAGHGVPRHLTNTAGVLHLPPITVEQAQRSTDNLHPTVLNEDELEGTRTIRRLAEDMGHDTDGTLVRVAQGQYDGVWFALGERTPAHELFNAFAVDVHH